MTRTGRKVTIYLDEDSQMLMDAMQQEDENVSAFIRRAIRNMASAQGYQLIEEKKYVKGPDE